MQNSEQISDHARPSKEDNSFSSKHLTIAIVITALIFGAIGYLVGQRTAQSPSQGNQEIASQPSPTSYDRTFMPPTDKPLAPITLYPVPTTYYQVPTSDPDLTANWKTYTSEKYGFSFHYPANMFINPIPCRPGDTCPPVSDYMLLETHQLPQGYNFEEILPTYRLERDGGGYLTIQVVSYDARWLLAQEDRLHGMCDLKDEGVKVGGKTGRIFSAYTITADKNCATGEKFHQIYAVLPLKEKQHILLDYDEGANNIYMHIDDFNQILSTFKFTN